MIYKVIGTGPQFPPGYKSDATTAGEALIKRQATEKLCGSAVVIDASGRKLTFTELKGIAKEEREAASRKLRRD